MAEFTDGRIQDGSHHEVESEWMILSQIELVMQVGSQSGVRVFLSKWWDQDKQVCLSLTRKTKMAEYNMAEFKMAAIIKLSQNE